MHSGIDRRGWIPLTLYAAIGIAAWLLFPDHFIADDSYFYPVVARHIVLEGSQTFSGVVPTNGVHPFWLYLLTGYSWLVALLDPALLWKAAYAVPLAALLLGLGAAGTWRLAGLLDLPPTLFTAVPLTYLTMFGVLYSEAHLHYLMLVALLIALARGGVETRRDVWLVGLAASGVFLARLDSVFVIGACLGAALLTTASRWRVVAAASLAALPALAYVVSNQAFFGGLVPVSGWMKSTFPEIAWKDWDLRGGAVWMGNSIPFGIAPLLGGMLLVATRRRISDERGLWMSSLLIGALCQSVYVALFTRGHTSWYWYYVPHILLAAFVACEAASRISRSSRLPSLAGIGVLLVGAFVVVHQTTSTGMSRTQRAIFEFVTSAGIQKSGILISDWPGHVAFHTSNHVFAIDMLTASRRFYEEMSGAQDPIGFLLDEFRGDGRPIRYVIWEGSPRFGPSDDLRQISFHDPRAMPALRSLGKLTIPEGPFYVDKAQDLVVWKIGP